MPYWSVATDREILRSLFSGDIIDGRAPAQLRRLIMQELGVEEAILCGSGSLALEIALRACTVRQGDEVVIPAFCCTSVVLPILAVGAVPVLADIGEELNLTPETVEPVLTEKTSAIVVPHLFGNPAGIDAIVELARARRIRVVDDAAQALGATLAGQPAGSFGDAGIVSFGSEKVCSGLGGGVVVSRFKDTLSACSMDLSPPRISPVLRNFLAILIWRRWRRWTLPMQFSQADTGPDAPPVPYRKELMANLNAAVAVTLVQILRENITARRARVQAYRNLLGSEQRLKLIPHQSGSACLTQVVQVLPSRRGTDMAARLIEVLRRDGYEAQGSYVPIHLLSGHERWAGNRLPYTERVWPDLIELPCEPGVSLAHVERIAATIKQALS